MPCLCLVSLDNVARYFKAIHGFHSEFYSSTFARSNNSDTKDDVIAASNLRYAEPSGRAF